MATLTIETREVLAGAYKGAHPSALLTHSVVSDIGGDYVTLCRRMQIQHMADANPDGLEEAPTCKRCLQRDPRFATRE